MKVLVETAAGFAIFSLKKPGVMTEVKDITKEYDTVDKMSSLVKLSAFSKFKKADAALLAMKDLNESRIPERLAKLLKRQWKGKSAGDELAVCDAKLGTLIKEKMGIATLHNTGVVELVRGIRSQISDLVTKVSEERMNQLSLGLSHSYARYKLKFSSKKIDAMVIQAISLLDDLDKELNSYSMKCKEWYGWHFPELARVVSKNINYVSCVKRLGFRSSIDKADFEGILTHEEAEEVREEALVSKGTDISDDDLENIFHLCDQIIGLTEYRKDLEIYIHNRMQALSPNLTTLVGDLVAARLLAKAGGLQQLAKQPASTIQILGAEKALFKAIRAKKPTPKYGLIYHATMVKDCDPRFKGKFSRKLAAKAALSVRMDAFTEKEDDKTQNYEEDSQPGEDYKLYLMKELQRMEYKATGKDFTKKRQFQQYDSNLNADASSGSMLQRKPMAYNDDADVTVKRAKQLEPEAAQEEAQKDVEEEKPKKKRKRKAEDAEAEPVAEEEKEPKKKKKKSEKKKKKKDK